MVPRHTSVSPVSLESVRLSDGNLEAKNQNSPPAAGPEPERSRGPTRGRTGAAGGGLEVKMVSVLPRTVEPVEARARCLRCCEPL